MVADSDGGAVGRGYEGVVVLGVPRSGTTLMRRLLDAHPAIACPPETNLLNAAARFLEEGRFAGGLSVGVVPGLEFSDYTEAEVLGRLREFVFGFLRDIATKRGSELWAEKTAVDIFHIDQIERLCGDHCRYIGVVRHPLDVVCSIRELSDKMGMYMAELHRYVQRFAAPAEAFAHAWAEANDRLLGLIERRPAGGLLVRYEDLVSDPAEEVRRVSDFLDAPTDPTALIERAMGSKETSGLGDWKTYSKRDVSAASVGRWKELDPWMVRRLHPVVGPVAGRLGYELEFSAEEPDESRMGELSRMVAKLKMRT